MMWQLKYQDAVEEGRAEGRREGRQEGRREGRQEGRREEKIAFAQKLLKRNRPIDEIGADTGLTYEEVLALSST